ncbi:MAG: CopD family protein [Halofilum sp. (in: g-proteobacteria)]
MLPLTLALHALAAVVWVGGMAFAYGILRPVAGSTLAGPERLALWHGVFSRFFRVVWVAVAVLLATGYYMTLVPFGGFAQVGLHIHTMHGLALLMAAIFAHLFFAPWQRFRRAVDQGENESAGVELGRIRTLVALNLTLGLIVVVVATAGRYWY